MRRIPYRTVGGRTLSLHVSSVGVGGAPVAVFYHGGGWVRGDWTQFRPQAARLAELGMATVLVEYRTEGPVVATDDALAAMAVVFERVGELGGDPGRVVAVGGSAGGQLALGTALFPWGAGGGRPAALVLFNPVTDTTGEFPGGFGGRYFDEGEGVRYSPVHSVGVGVPPVLIMHGTGDTAVHHENSVVFGERVRECGGEAEVVLYRGERHGFFNPVSADSPGRCFESTVSEMIRFLRRCFGL